MYLFICYRRNPSWELSRLLCDNLELRGYDIFMDIEDIQEGRFDQVILENIKKCDYFLPILEDGTLDKSRIMRDGDWVKREIEFAIKNNKKIVPILAEDFHFPTDNDLPPSIISLKYMNGVLFPFDYFDEAVDKLTKDFLKPSGVIGDLSVDILDQYLFQEEDSSIYEVNIIATFECEADEKSTLEDACRTIAYDPTIGTWTEFADVDREEILYNFCGKVLLPIPTQNKNKGKIRIAYPINIIDPSLGGISQLLAVLGAPFGLKIYKSLRLTNIQFPNCFLNSFPGPKFGLDGIYKLLNQQPNRPLLATMLKPRSGLDSASYAKIAYEALIGGVDLIFDDELMVSPKSAPFEERVPLVDAAVQRAAKETGLNKYYAVNITSSLRDIQKTALRAKELGADLIYINPLTTGFSSLEILSSIKELNIPIVCCRSLQGVFHRGENGIDIYVLMKLARIAGADGMHIGSISGKLPHLIAGGEEEVKNRAFTLTGRFGNMKPMIPILSGGLHPGNIEWNLQHIGRKVILQAGSGVLGHPDGPRAGAEAMRTMVDHLLAGKRTFEVGKINDSVYHALQKWGYVEDGKINSI